MAEDYGLLSGLAKGVNAGLDAYNSVQDRNLRIKQYQDDLEVKKLLRDQQEKQIQMDQASKGLISNGSGGFELNEQKQEEEQIKNGLLKAQAAKANAEAKEALTKAGTSGNLASKYATKEPNKEMFSAAGFAKRMEQAENVFNDLEKKGFKYGNKESLLSSDFVPGVLQSENLRSQNQAEKNFVNAILRKESGAAISPAEFDSAAKQYFPRPGDTPEVLEQKRANRLQSVAALKAEGGSAYGLIPTVETAPAPKRGLIGAQKAISADDQQALQWASENPNDPRAKAIRQKLGM